VAEPAAGAGQQRAAEAEADVEAACLLFFRFSGTDEAEVDQTQLIQRELLERVQDSLVVLGALLMMMGEKKRERERENKKK
jgi:hypothetical protein